MTGTFVRLAPWTLGARAMVMVMGIAATSVLTRTMTPQEWDDYSFLKATFLMYIWMLGQLGLNDAALRFGSELSVRGDVSGFRRMVGKFLLVQVAAMVAILGLFWILQGYVDALFSVAFGMPLVMTILLGGITIFKETLRQGYVAAYFVKLVAVVSVVGNIAFPIACYVFIAKFKWGVAGGLAGEGIGYVLMIVVFAAGLVRLKFVRSVAQTTEEAPVTAGRVFRYSAAITANNLMTLLFGYNTVVFLIRYFMRHDPEGPVGIYNLASMLPQQGMTFLTLAIIPLITAMFTKEYYSDRTRLPELIKSYYKLMILMVVPLVAFGLVFLDLGLEFLSGARGEAAGSLAIILLPLNLATIILMPPISVGLNVLEKAHRMILPRIVSGTLGIVIAGALLAIWPTLYSVAISSYARTLLITPIIMYLAVRLVGGFYFPYAFFFRAVIASASVALLFPMRFFWHFAQGLSGRRMVGEGLFMLVVAAAASVLMIIAARLVGVFRSEEIKYFRNARIPGMEFLMKVLVPRKYRSA
jgi:O-antigen/teichoic acid export membrane protein